MLCAVIKGPTFEEARSQLTQAAKDCSLVELRLDFFKVLDLDQLKKLRQEFSIPMIFTLRPSSQGGSFVGSEEERLDLIKKLITLKPEYIDFEYTVDPSFIKKLKTENHETKVIVSFHDFEKMPPLFPILQKLRRLDADLYKMAVMLHSSSEALSLLHFMKENQPNLLVMGMGPYGEITRILSPFFGGRFVYAKLGQELSTAPGQLTVEQLTTIYHYQDLNPSTAIYGLIGDPVSRSIGYLTHNAIMHQFHLSAIYVNFPVAKEQLAEFIDWARKIGVAGLSVTMPLKEEIIPLIDEIDPWADAVGAVNTLLFDKGKIKGFNTDGKGGADALEKKMKVKGKKIIFMGAGGAVKAFAKEVIDREATVLILNRDAEKAIRLSAQLGCRGGALNRMASECKLGYDILINATSDLIPIDPEFILENSVVMDLNTQLQMTAFLEKAKEKKCVLVYGYEMFVNQAIGQFNIWFGSKKFVAKQIDFIAQIKKLFRGP